MFITQTSNVDYLIDLVRLRVGDFDGTAYSAALVRTAIISAVRYIQTRWNSKYQVFTDTTAITPQPGDGPTGYVYCSTVHGDAWLPDTLAVNDVFRNPYVQFTQTGGVFEQDDEQAVITVSAYLLLLAKMQGSSDSLVSWATEDIRYSNLGAERARSTVLESLQTEIQELFRSRIARPQISRVPLADITAWTGVRVP